MSHYMLTHPFHTLPIAGITTMVDVSRPGVYDCICFVLSSGLFLFCALLTFYAICTVHTDFYPSQVPGWAALLIFLLDLFLLALVEGLMVALVEMKREDPSVYQHTHPRAFTLGQSATSRDNMERFLMGRQVIVIYLVFISAKLSTIIFDSPTFLYIPVPLIIRQVFFETGFLGCFVVAILSQLLPEVVAVKFPIEFLDFVLMKPIYWTCVALERSGLVHVCWLLARLVEVTARLGAEPQRGHRMAHCDTCTCGMKPLLNGNPEVMGSKIIKGTELADTKREVKQVDMEVMVPLAVKCDSSC